MNLVNLNEYGIKSINYYWERRRKFNISEQELHAIGISGDYAQVDKRLIPKLKEANKLFAKHGYEIIVKDGYRSKELYDLVRQKRYDLDGKENTDKTFSTGTNPHSTGLVVDINLVRLDDGKEVRMWNKADWPDGIFTNFYKDKKDPKSLGYQKLQDMLIKTMLELGFKLGKRKEFHHFELVV